MVAMDDAHANTPATDSPSPSRGLEMPPLSASQQPAANPMAGQTPSHPASAGSATTSETLTPPNFGKQMAQLVIIPAAIVIFCITMAVLFGMLAGAQTNIDAYLMKLRQSSGMGRTAFDLQDPRYKDRGLAAYNIATMIPTLKDPKERRRIGLELADILDTSVGKSEDMLQAYLLLALGQLGQDETFHWLEKGLDSEYKTVRQSAIGGILSWPDKTQAARAVPHLVRVLRDSDPLVVTEAAAALGELAQPGDTAVIEALGETLSHPGTGWREAGWNAAVALARLNDPLGSQIVVELLLNRHALSQLPMAESGRGSNAKMSIAGQNRIILSTLTAASDMQNEQIWTKITTLAEKDSSKVIRKAAMQLIRQHHHTQPPKTTPRVK